MMEDVEGLYLNGVLGGGVYSSVSMDLFDRDHLVFMMVLMMEKYLEMMMELYLE